jgi:DNA topoisomerase-1
VPNSHAAKAGAQEAHEAIRPTHAETGPNNIEGPDASLYALIWKRFIASQMSECKSMLTTIRINTTEGDKGKFGVFLAKGKFRILDGWRKIMGEKEQEDDKEEVEEILPNIEEKEWLTVKSLEALSRTTKPPQRYSQATLIKALESSGIGRPSSYASIMETIIGNQYVTEAKKKLHASELGTKMIEYLVANYKNDFIDINYTKRTEEVLDEIAQGKTAWQPFLANIARTLSDKSQKAGLGYDPLAAPEEGPACPKCGAITARRRAGTSEFWGCTKFPKCKGSINI